MLKFLSKRRRSRNLLLYMFIFLMSASMVALFSVVVSGDHGWFGGAPNNESTIAKVESYKITVKDLTDSLNAFSRQIQQNGISDPSSLYSTYGKQVMDGLIHSKLVEYEAGEIGLSPTDDEVRNQIKQTFTPWPGYDQYKARLVQAGITVDQFEDQLRAQVAEEKLRSYVTAGAIVSPQEVEDDYKKTNTSYDIRWVEVKADQMKDKVQFTDADAEAYFNAHKQDFRINEEQRRAKYIFIDQNKAGETIQVSDDELKKNFDPERGVKQVRVSEIVLNIPKKADSTAAASKPGNVANKGTNGSANAGAAAPSSSPSPDDAVKKKADDIVAKARGSQGAPAQDFAKLAHEYSEDAKTKGSGGDIGWVNKDDKRDSDDPLNRVFTMKKDEISPPIKKGDNYYILKISDRKIPTFEESRDQLLKEARAQKGYTKAVDIGTEAEKKFKESKNADAVVAEINKEFGVDVASVKKTPYFAEGDSLPELGPAPDLQSSIFELPAPGDIAERQNVSGGFAIPQYEDKRDPHDPTFEEVKSKVADAYRMEKANELASQKAAELAKAKTPDELKTMADAMGITPDDKAGVTGNDPIGPLMSDAGRAPVYKLNPGQVTPEPIKVENSDDWVVVGLKSRKDADMGAGFEKDRKSIEDKLLNSKREMLFSAFLDSAEKRLKDEGKIVIYDKVIAQALNMPSTTPKGGPGGFPGGPGGMPGLPPGRQRPRRTAPLRKS
ncbi:MAG TPA: peptidyl-prolyl cis-trans isomerase [Blastocatellia bacterium]